MEPLSVRLKLDDSVAKATNLCSRFSEDDLAALGTAAWEGYQLDEASRGDWLRRTEAAMDLALQTQKDKSFPWPDCANIAFPLVTIAAMQFHARAYPTLINGSKIVKCRVPGPDPTGELTATANAVSTYMSYQITQEDKAWEEGMDRLLLQLPIVGSVFKKTRHDGRAGHNVSDLIPAKNLCLNYYAKSVEDCSRKTQIIPFYRNEVHERCKSGVWLDITKEPWYQSIRTPFKIPGTEAEDDRKGMHAGQPDDATPLTFLEQHCLLDLDQDGYFEPYILTFEATTQKVVRLVARWDLDDDVLRNMAGEVICINTTEMYTKYELIPSPDGGIYGMGFGILLGPLNETVNDLINMMADWGTLSIASGGFLARGVKIRGGAYTFSPFEWNRVDSSGDDLQKGIVPLPVREAPNLLFQLLGFLVDYTQRVGGSTDATQGQNPGQNTKVGTQESMIEQGQVIYSGLFKRVWRAMKSEFEKLFILDGKFLPQSKSFGSGGKVLREWFMGDPSNICPEADPNVVSTTMRLQKASAIAQRAHMVPGYDTVRAELNLLRAMEVDGIETLFPGPDKVPPLPNPKAAVEQIKGEVKMKLEERKLQQAQMEFIANMQEEQRLNAANIIKLMAQAELFAAQAEGVERGHQIALIESMIGAAKARDDHLRGQVDQMLKGIQLQIEQDERAREAGGKGTGQAGTAGTGGGSPPMASGPGDQASLSMGAA